jgi:broad-specificity NMP kinase
MAIIAIAGGPLSGKTTLGEELGLTSGTPLLRTDDLAGFRWCHRTQRRMATVEWSAVSEAAAARILTATGDLIVEGVAVGRALRKVLGYTTGRPIDRLIILTKAHEPLTPAQDAMRKGVWTVLAAIEMELRARGVEIEAR